MSTIYEQYPHMAGHIVCVVDVETTDIVPRHLVEKVTPEGKVVYESVGGEVVQIAIQPINLDYEPYLKPFYTNVRPINVEGANYDAMRAHGIDVVDLLAQAPMREKVVQLFDRWFDALDLPKDRKIIPVAHNWPFEFSYLTWFFGRSRFDSCFHYHPRDTLQMALFLRDRAARMCYKQPFHSVGLQALCKVFDIQTQHAHNALQDCLAEAKLYKKLVELELSL